MTARAAKLKAEGKDIIGLGAGEPDFDTPAHIARRGHRGHPHGASRATPRRRHRRAQGRHHRQVQARQRPRPTSARRSSSPRAPSRRSSTCALALLDPGDEAIIPAPYWVSYPDMVLLADGVPGDAVSPGADQGYKITPRAAWRPPSRPRRKLLLLNSPEQPHRRRLHARGAQGAWEQCCSSTRKSSSAPMTCTSTSTGQPSRS